jgi:hypothetical protein
MALSLTAAQASAASSTLFRFDFKAHGYVVAASGERTTVVIKVSRNSKHRGAETAYIARGTTTGGLRAVFPGIGRIAMDFEPTGHWHALAHCARGQPRRERAGVFVGKLRFVGEHRYLTAVRSRARGSERRYGRACRSNGDREGDRHSMLRFERPARFGPSSIELSPAGRNPRTRLFAGFRSGPLARAFEASKQAQGRLRMAATEENVVDDLGTYRTAFAFAPRNHLQAARTLSSANLKAVAPFAGSAALRRAKSGSRSWTGDLTASFLGDPDVPMTGPPFKSRLSRGF